MKARFTLGIGFANAHQEEIVEIDQDEWDACETDAEREELLETYWEEWSGEFIDGGYEIIEAGIGVGSE